MRDKDVSQSLKTAARVLQYPELKGIPIERVNTHSLRIGGANALVLAGYNEMQIQKMRRWKVTLSKSMCRNNSPISLKACHVP